MPSCTEGFGRYSYDVGITTITVTTITPSMSTSSIDIQSRENLTSRYVVRLPGLYLDGDTDRYHTDPHPQPALRHLCYNPACVPSQHSACPLIWGCPKRCKSAGFATILRPKPAMLTAHHRPTLEHSSPCLRKFAVVALTHFLRDSWTSYTLW